MSGGGKSDRKSRVKAQGWEEAGAEFYQESYPAGTDWPADHRDPAAIATLLPSKQNRYATTRGGRLVGGVPTEGRGTRRYSHGTTATRRRNSTVNTRRGSQYPANDVQVAMMPDLSENLTDEERIWEEIHEIKSMPVPMAQKKELKAQLNNATKLRLQGMDQFKWQRRKFIQRLKSRSKEFFKKMELWRGSLKIIEGNFGTGVVAYFLFLRWLMFLNLFIFTVILVVIVLPQVFLAVPQDRPCTETNENTSVECCAENYFNNSSDDGGGFAVLDFIQGTGFMEKTILFYGMYSNKIFGTHYYENPNQDESSNSSGFGFQNLVYDLPMAYICSAAVFFSCSIFAIVRSASKEFKDRLVEGEGQFYLYCNLVFGGWDFCIDNEKSANIKHKALFNEVIGLLQSKKIEMERHNRSRELMLKLIGIRVLVNFLIFIILAGAGVLIYFLFNTSMTYLDPKFSNSMVQSKNTPTTTTTLLPLLMLQDRQFEEEVDLLHFGSESGEREAKNGRFMSSLTKKIFPRTDTENMTNGERFTVLFYEYLPYMAIVFMNLIVPLFFNYLVKFEKYTPLFIIKVTLLRTVLLRLSSLGVLLSRFYFLISPSLTDEETQCFNRDRGTPQCWETFIGQQFYKLFIVDFVTQIFVTFFVNFPRAMFAKHSGRKFAKFIGEQEFELPRHVLDVVYSQTICWLGCFYAPFLPGIAVVLNFFMFYVKKFACLVNSRPSAILYRASRSNSLFMFILLLSFVAAIVPIVYSVVEIMPSRSCGPFRGLNTVWDAAVIRFLKMPTFLQNVVFFLGTAGFAIPCFIVLLLFLYYYHAISAANKHMVEVLKFQLILEGHDKQFLLNRLSTFIKQHQEFQKKIRQLEVERREREREPQQPPLPNRNSSTGSGSGPPPIVRSSEKDRHSTRSKE